jgi:hypothetical protein
MDRFANDGREQLKELEQQIADYSTRLLNQCVECGRTYTTTETTTCDYCGGDVEPISRVQVLRPLCIRRGRLNVKIHRLQEALQ